MNSPLSSRLTPYLDRVKLDELIPPAYATQLHRALEQVEPYSTSISRSLRGYESLYTTLATWLLTYWLLSLSIVAYRHVRARGVLGVVGEVVGAIRTVGSITIFTEISVEQAEQASLSLTYSSPSLSSAARSPQSYQPSTTISVPNLRLNHIHPNTVSQRSRHCLKKGVVRNG